MLKIKIAHLYYDILNLYGENGNIRALKKYIERQDVKCEIHFLTINDKIDFNEYDLFYMGMGTEEGLLLVLKDIIKYKKEIKEAIEKGKFFIATGNSFELFGEEIYNFRFKPMEALNIFEYHTMWKGFRIVESVYASTKLIKEPIIGFQNRNGHMYDVQKSLFKYKEGTGMNLGSKLEGYHYKNFYGTYLLGPLLIRNPHLTNYIVKSLIHSKNKKYKFKIYNRTTEIKAYNTYIDNFINKEDTVKN